MKATFWWYREIPGASLREAIEQALSGETHMVSRREICRNLNRCKAPYIINELEDMVREGIVSRLEFPYKNTFMYVYQLNSGSVQ